MIRPSLLPIARYCGHAIELHEKYPQGSTAASAGAAWHERMAAHIRGEIDDSECGAIFGTMPKHDLVDAEVRCQLLDENGLVVTEGTADAVLYHGDDAITVIDWKTGLPDKVDPPDDNLQLLAYGLGKAMERGFTRFRVGLYFTQAPPVRLGRWIELAEFDPLFATIKAATALPRDVPVVGPHCERCYRRSYCRAWLLPAVDCETSLAPFSKPGGVTRQNAAAALQVVSAIEDAIELAKAQLKEYARQNGGIEREGKVWGPVPRRTPKRISYAAADAAGLLPQLQEAKAISGGDLGETFAWRTVKK